MTACRYLAYRSVKSPEPFESGMSIDCRFEQENVSRQALTNQKDTKLAQPLFELFFGARTDSDWIASDARIRFFKAGSDAAPGNPPRLQRLGYCSEKNQGMHPEPIEIFDFKQLRQFVSKTLCLKNDFEEGIFQITEQILKRGEKICGVFFCLHGPRSVKLTAVWEMDANSILFYGSNGERFQRTAIAIRLNQAA